MISGRVTLVAAALVALFVALAAALVATSEVPRLDLAVSAFFRSHRGEVPPAPLFWITAFGTRPTLVAVMAAVTALLWAHRRAGLLLPLWVTYLGTEAVTWGAMQLIDRHRPILVAAASASLPSFPSAHSAGALAVYGFLAYLVSRETVSRRRRVSATLVAAVLILAIGLSPVFLGVHYLSDALGGFLIAGEWLLVGCAVAGGGDSARR